MTTLDYGLALADALRAASDRGEPTGLATPTTTHPRCGWCGEPAATCPAPAEHARADRASETTWRRGGAR